MIMFYLLISSGTPTRTELFRVTETDLRVRFGAYKPGLSCTPQNKGGIKQGDIVVADFLFRLFILFSIKCRLR